MMWSELTTSCDKMYHCKYVFFVCTWGCGGRTAGNHSSLLHQDVEELAVQHQVDFPHLCQLCLISCVCAGVWGWTVAPCHCYRCDIYTWHQPDDESSLVSKCVLSTMQHCFLCSDWCISRQLWWGHQIPAYRVELPNCTDKPEVGLVLISMLILMLNVRFVCCVMFVFSIASYRYRSGWLVRSIG